MLERSLARGWLVVIEGTIDVSEGHAVHVASSRISADGLVALHVLGPIGLTRFAAFVMRFVTPLLLCLPCIKKMAITWRIVCTANPMLHGNIFNASGGNGDIAIESCLCTSPSVLCCSALGMRRAVEYSPWDAAIASLTRIRQLLAASSRTSPACATAWQHFVLQNLTTPLMETVGGAPYSCPTNLTIGAYDGCCSSCWSVHAGGPAYAAVWTTVLTCRSAVLYFRYGLLTLVA